MVGLSTFLLFLGFSWIFYTFLLCVETCSIDILDLVAQVARHPIPHGQPCGYRAQGLAGPGPGGRGAGAGGARDAPGAAAAADSAAGDAKSKA